MCYSAGLALAESKTRDIPPPPPSPPFTDSTSARPQASQDSSAIETARPILELADAVLPAVPKPATLDDTQSAPVSKTTKGGKAKMRPSPTKNGRYVSKKLALIPRSFVPSNLCAHRWRKQVPSNGSTEEFQKYYNDLTADQRKVSSLLPEMLGSEAQQLVQSYDDETTALVGTYFLGIPALHPGTQIANNGWDTKMIGNGTLY